MAFGGKDSYPVHSGPSFTNIDGVPIKLDSRFRAPQKVTLPMNYQLGNPTDVLFLEYDFGLEEGVLDWTDRQRKQKALAEKAKRDQVVHTIQEFAQPQNQETEENVNSPKDRTRESSEVGASSGHGVETIKTTTETTVQLQGGTPFFHGQNLGGILVPTPIDSAVSEKHENASANKASFNIADFEREQDPFENMELKVLNDMEELDKVLQASSEANQRSHQTGGTSAMENIVTQTQQPSSPRTTAASGVPQFVPRSTPVQAQPAGVTSLSHVEYPDIDSIGSSIGSTNSYPSGLYSFPNTSATTLASSVSSAAEQVQFTATGARFSKAPMPSGYSSNLPAHTTAPTNLNLNTANRADVSAYPAQGQKGVNDMAKAFQEFLSRSGPACNAPPNGFVNTDNLPRPRDWSPPPTMNRLRSARSVPDLAAMDDSKSNAYPASAMGKSPVPARSRTQTPPPRPSSVKAWNIYKPLPSTSNGFDQAYVIPSGSDCGPGPSVHPSRPARPVKPDTLPNPYNSLSAEAKRFADNIADMGFPRARVARAVEKLGLDDKKVLDHLCAVNRMSEKGYNPEHSEVSLSLFGQTEAKAAQYLQLVKQFRELGFDEKKIKEALLSCDLDENKALDSLFAP